uniref:Uncharacterized protein n=1 Tax=Aegilops tauschii subsp. strangulata TaxID=200361 RepID=A0A453GDR3_AEGTS
MLTTVWMMMDGVQGRAGVGVGELQGQPAVRHVVGAPVDVLRGHAAGHLLPVPAGVGAVEPAAGGGGGVRVHPGDHRRRHRAALRGRHTLGADQRVRGGGGRAAARLHPGVGGARGRAPEAAPARQPGHEAGRALPPAGQARRRLRPGAQRARPQAAAPGGRVSEARPEGARLERRPRQRPQAVVACVEDRRSALHSLVVYIFVLQSSEDLTSCSFLVRFVLCFFFTTATFACMQQSAVKLYAHT